MTLPPLARAALDHYLVQRCLPTTPKRCNPDTPLVGDIVGHAGETGINRARLWVVMKRFFTTVAEAVRQDNPAFAEKLRRATPRDNLRHSSLATTSMYLHSDDIQRVRQMTAVFTTRIR